MQNFRTGLSRASKVPLRYIDRRPVGSFLTVLVIFLVLIVVSNFLRRPKQVQQEVKQPAKSVSIYQIGEAPKISVQAQIEKSGVVQITSLTAGVVQTIYHKEGENVHRGDWLVGLSTNYQGGNLPSLQRQIAQRQLQNVEDTYQEQKDVIGKQRDVANKTEENASDLRDITAKSIGETQDLISLNNDILNTLQQNLDQYQASNSAGMNNQLILTTKQLKSQFMAANNQLNQALRNSQYQSDDKNPPAELARAQRDITLKQLDIQEKSLDLNRDISRLQLQVARVSEALMFPSAPFPATVQRVFVKVGQAVQPGTPLMILSENAALDPIVAIAYVPRTIAESISNLEPSILHFDNFIYSEYPSYITQDAVQGTLYGVYFPLPDNYSRYTTDKGYITIDLPVGYYDTSAEVPFIPIDAVYESQDQAYIFVNKDGKARSQQIKLGSVYGRFVQVESGIHNGDQIILDRNVVDGDLVTNQ